MTEQLLQGSAQPCVSGKIAFVTGAGRGIGRAIALAVARAGADVAVNDLPESEGLSEVVAAWQQLGVRAIAAPADLGNRDQVEAAIDKTVEE